MSELRTKVAKGLLWKLLERFSTQIISFVVSLVLARMLGPDSYGVVALLAIFIAVANVFVSSGLGTALIQKKSMSDADCNTMFYLSLAMSLVVYAVLFAGAPFVAEFYKMSCLVRVLRVLGLVVVINAMNGIQSSILNRQMAYHLSFRINLISIIAMGGVGVSMAYFGYGYWALVFSQLSGSFATMVGLWVWVKWRPQILFSVMSMRSLYSFSWKLLCSGLIESVFSNLYGLVIGRVYTATDLALYNRGDQFPRFAMDAVNGTLTSVTFPALSQMQDNREQLKNTLRSMIKFSNFFVMPMMAGLAACAPGVVDVLLGESWNGAIIYLQLACFTYAFWPFHSINLQAINALGRSDVYLKLEILKKIVVVLALVGSYRYGMLVFACVFSFVMTPLGVLINTWPNQKLLRYGFFAQIGDVVPTLVISVVVFALATVVRIVFCHWDVYFVLAMQVLCGVASYALLNIGFKTESYKMVLSQLMYVRDMTRGRA